MRYAALVLILAACQRRGDRNEQLANCKAVYQTSQEVVRCLVERYNWEPGAALHATNVQRAVERRR